PCLEHQIGRCPAPCVLPVEPQDYAESLQEVDLFLRGRGAHLVDRLRERMAQASEDLEFERAARYRDQISAIERSLERQHVAFSGQEDIDVIGLYREGADGVAQILEVRRGLLAGSRSHVLRGVELPDEAVVEDVMLSRYDGNHPIPDRIVTPTTIEDVETWEELLGDLRGRSVRVHHPQRGDKRKLLEMAQRNAEESFRSQRKNADQALATLETLQRRLGLERLPSRIECYDISNIQGTDPTGSMVVAIDGEIAPKHYRSFNVRSQDTPDDFKMMEEVLTRRFERGEALGELPDLVVIDGGKGQLGIAVAVLDSLEVTGVELCSLAKSRVLDADGQIQGYRGGMPTSEEVERSPERVFRPGRKNPVALKPNSNGLFLLQKLRDEAHRFAITHHKRRRKKRNLRSALHQIDGVGPKRVKALLTRFGSLQGVREATEEQLATVSGISPELARRLKSEL
ncbi:MAG: excinuclease ABC subunit UvrC, partial [Myxococcota bacterium]|nr:excinuclease ABC subunit UvrC [Myxococcota bacterium]